MSIEENKAVAKRWNVEIVSSQKLEAFGEVLAESYVHYNASDSSWSPNIQGLEHAEAFFGKALAEYPTYRVSVDDIIGEGDRVAARLTHSLEGKPVRHAIVFCSRANAYISLDTRSVDKIHRIVYGPQIL